MDGTQFIGHNSQRVNSALKELYNCTNIIKSSMTDKFDDLSSTMAAKWEGADEIAAEGTFADAMGELYQACLKIIAEAYENVRKVGEGWLQWTESNSIEGGRAVEQGTMTPIDNEEINTGDVLALPITQKTFQGEGVGITTPEAYQDIIDAIDAYGRSVYSGVRELYTTIETHIKAGLLGEEQAAAAASYLNRVNQLIADTSISFQTLKQKVGEAAKTVLEQAAATASELDEQNPGLADEAEVNTASKSE